MDIQTILCLGYGSFKIAAFLGARIIEKHFTFDKNLPGNDHYHSMDKVDLKNFLANFSRIQTLLGEKNKHSLESESIARQNARRSLVARNIKKGTILKKRHLSWKRPANGISPKDINEVIGKAVKFDIKADEIITREVISNPNGDDV